MTLDQAFEQLKTLVETEVSKSSTRMAAELNQAVRRLRHAPGEAEIAALLVNVPQEGHSLCVTFEGLQARIDSSTLIAIQDSPALVSVIESKDTVVTAGTAKELSEALYRALDCEGRVHLIPILAEGSVRMVLVATDLSDTAAMETLCEAAGLRLERPVPTIAASKKWDDLPETEQLLHLQAQRFAQVAVARMRVEHIAAVRDGQKQANLYGALREQIDQARAQYKQQFLSGNSKTMVDYLYVEIVRSLANDEDRMLGAGFPGRLT